MTEVQLPVAVVGPGDSGRRVTRVLRRLSGYRTDYLVVREAGAQPMRTASDNWSAALTDPTVRAIVICEPTTAKMDLAADAVSAGKHVLVEAPTGLVPQQISALRALAARFDRIVAVLFRLTCHPLLEHAANVIRRGEIGEPVHAAFRFFPSGPARGSPFAEMLVDGFHLAERLLGPLRVLSAENYEHAGRVVGGTVVARHDSGCVTTLETSVVGTGRVRCALFEVIGTGRSLVWDQSAAGRRKDTLRIADDSTAIAEVTDIDAGFVRLLQRFREACDGSRNAVDEVNLRTAETALLRACEARERSAHTV